MSDLDPSERPSTRLPKRAKEMHEEVGAPDVLVAPQASMNSAILEELDRLHAIVRKHNLS